MVRHSVSTRIVRECDSPQLVDDDRFSFFVLDLSHECPGYRIEGIDRASVSVVRYQQRITQWAKIPRCHCNPPRLIQRCAFDQSLHKCSIFFEQIDEAAAFSVYIRERHAQQTVDVLDPEWSKARRQCRVGEGFHEGKTRVIDVDFAVRLISRVKQISRGPASYRQSCVDGFVCRIVYGQNCLIEIRLRRPSADRSIQRYKQKKRCPSLHLKII